MPILRAANGETVCDFGSDEQYYPTEGKEPNEADAKLIAAAPELMAVVGELLLAFAKGVRSLEDFEEEKLYDAASKAYEKAGGR